MAPRDTIGEVEEARLQDILWKGFMTLDMDKVGSHWSLVTGRGVSQ